MRQWVLSMPFEIRYRLAWGGKMLSAVLAIFLRVVFGWYRRKPKSRATPADAVARDEWIV